MERCIGPQASAGTDGHRPPLQLSEKVLVEPVTGEGEFGLLESVAGVAPFEGELGAGLFEEDGEALGAVLRDHVVMASGEEKNRGVVELRGLRGFQRDHGTKENSAGEDVGPKEEHGCGDVGAVGVTDGNHFAEMTAGALVFDEVGKFVGAADEVVLVEDAGGEAAEETGLAVFEDLAARTEQGRAGAEDAAEREEIIFVATGAVKQKERGRGAGFEAGDHENFFSHGLGRIREDGLQPCDPGWRQFIPAERPVCGRNRRPIGRRWPIGNHTATNNLLTSSFIGGLSFCW